MDTAALTKDIFAAALGAAKGHASDLKDYLHARAGLIAEGVIAIETDRLSGAITKEDARFAFEQIRESEKTSALAVIATARAAAQDAINAALNVAANALNTALGIKLI